MRDILKKLQKGHHNLWTTEVIRSVIVAVLFFMIALAISHLANWYVLRTHGTAVDDLFLNHLPTVDIDGLIILGSLLITLLTFFLLIFKPRYLAFGLKALSLFIIMRACLISLTHLGPNPHQLVFDADGFGFGLYDILFNTSNDFFFSGHTGIPFLLALIFWPMREWRLLFIGTSIVFGVSVLLAHIHYSIDVFSAPLITYSIFIIAKKIFQRDYLTSIS